MLDRIRSSPQLVVDGIEKGAATQNADRLYAALVLSPMHRRSQSPLSSMSGMLIAFKLVLVFPQRRSVVFAPLQCLEIELYSPCTLKLGYLDRVCVFMVFSLSLFPQPPLSSRVSAIYLPHFYRFGCRPKTV